MARPTLTTAALAGVTALALTSCSAPASGISNDGATERTVLSPVADYKLDIAGNSRGLERTASGDLLLSAVAPDHMSTTVHRVDLGDVDAGDLEVTELRTASVPQADDGGTPIANLTDEELDNMARTVALQAEIAATPEGQDPPEEPSSEAIDLYTALFDLARERGQIGFGLTQVHAPDGQRSDRHVWQLGAAGASTMVDLTEDTAAEVFIDRPLRGLEGSIGACTVPADPAVVEEANTDEEGNPLIEEGDLAATSSASFVTSSGTGALVVRDPVTTFDHSVMEAVLPDASGGITLDNQDDAQRTVLLGLGELDCLNSDPTTGTDDHVAIFATVDTDMANKAMAHRKIVDAADAELIAAEESNNPDENLTPDITPTTRAHVPTETGHVVIVDGGSGLVTTIADSSEMVETYPELAGRDVTSIAVDESTYHHTGGRSRAGQSWWQRLLPGFLTGGSAESSERDPITAWVTYEDTPTLYKVEL